MPFLKISETLVSEMDLNEIQKELLLLGFSKQMVENIHHCNGSWPSPVCVKQHKSKMKEIVKRYNESKKALQKMDVNASSEESEDSETGKPDVCICCIDEISRTKRLSDNNAKASHLYKKYYKEKQQHLNNMNNAKNELDFWKRVLVVKSVDDYNIRVHGLVERMLDLEFERIQKELGDEEADFHQT